MPSFIELTQQLRRHISGVADKHADSALTFTDITTNDATTSKHGFMPKGSGSTSTFFRSDLTQAVPSSLVIATEQATTSGTSIDFTGIPTGIKRITVNLFGVSTNGTSNLRLQLGDSGGIEVAGYLGGNAAANFTAGFDVAVAAAASVLHGTFTLTLEDSSDNTWICTFSLARSDSVATHIGAGSKATSAVLDRIRLTTVNGTDAFDAGAMSIMYE